MDHMHYMLVPKATKHNQMMQYYCFALKHLLKECDKTNFIRIYIECFLMLSTYVLRCYPENGVIIFCAEFFHFHFKYDPKLLLVSFLFMHIKYR